MTLIKIKVQPCSAEGEPLEEFPFFIKIEAKVDTGDLIQTRKLPHKLKVIKDCCPLHEEDDSLSIINLKDIVTLEEKIYDKDAIYYKPKDICQWEYLEREVINSTYTTLVDRRTDAIHSLLESYSLSEEEENILIPKLERLLEIKKELRELELELFEQGVDSDWVMYQEVESIQDIMNDIIVEKYLRRTPTNYEIAQNLLKLMRKGLSSEEAAEKYLEEFNWIKKYGNNKNKS